MSEKSVKHSYTKLQLALFSVLDAFELGPATAAFMNPKVHQKIEMYVPGKIPEGFECEEEDVEHL